VFGKATVLVFTKVLVNPLQTGFAVNEIVGLGNICTVLVNELVQPLLDVNVNATE